MTRHGEPSCLVSPWRLARMMGIRDRVVYRWITYGMPHARLGGRFTRLHLDEAREWLALHPSATCMLTDEARAAIGLDIPRVSTPPMYWRMAPTIWRLHHAALMRDQQVMPPTRVYYAASGVPAWVDIDTVARATKQMDFLLHGRDEQGTPVQVEAGMVACTHDAAQLLITKGWIG